MTDVAFHTKTDGTKLAYQHIPAKTDAHPDMPNTPGLLFLPGHNSDMFGSKADILMNWAAECGLGFTRMDYFGHGLSDGNTLDGTISRWTDDALAILDRITSGPQILVGSSLGGWIMLNVAVQRQNRIKGLIGIAAAPDFTERLIWDTLDEDARAQVIKTGHLAVENPYSDDDVIYPYPLITDGRKNLRLTQPIEFDGPVVLHQGMSDHEVPWQTAIDISAALTSDNVRLNLVKEAGHRFSEDDQLEMIVSSAEMMIVSIDKDFD